MSKKYVLLLSGALLGLPGNVFSTGKGASECNGKNQAIFKSSLSIANDLCNTIEQAHATINARKPLSKTEVDQLSTFIDLTKNINDANEFKRLYCPKSTQLPNNHYGLYAHNKNKIFVAMGGKSKGSCQEGFEKMKKLRDKADIILRFNDKMCDNNIDQEDKNQAKKSLAKEAQDQTNSVSEMPTPANTISSTPETLSAQAEKELAMNIEKLLSPSMNIITYMLVQFNKKKHITLSFDEFIQCFRGTPENLRMNNAYEQFINGLDFGQNMNKAALCRAINAAVRRLFREMRRDVATEIYHTITIQKNLQNSGILSEKDMELLGEISGLYKKYEKVSPDDFKKLAESEDENDRRTYYEILFRGGNLEGMKEYAGFAKELIERANDNALARKKIAEKTEERKSAETGAETDKTKSQARRGKMIDKKLHTDPSEQ